MYATRAEEIIRESRLDAPYFLYVSLTMVHAPFQVGDKNLKFQTKGSPFIKHHLRIAKIAFNPP